jgi:predicted amidohydrolase
MGMEAAETAIRPSLHGGGFNRPRVVDLVLSPDGRHLAAAYYVPPMNRPGTDWGAWVAVWNLTTGERTIIPNATQPLAISPDGQWLAMGLYTRSEDHRWRMGPRSEPALWKPGAVEPARKLTCDIEPGTWLAWTFSTDGKELLAFNEDGRLVSWEMAGESPAKTIETLDAPRAETLATRTDQQSKWRTPVDLRTAGNEVRNQLILVASSQGVRPQEPRYTVEASWNKEKSKWFRRDLNVIKTPPYSRPHAEHLLASSQLPYGLSLPAELASLYIQDPPARRLRIGGAWRLVFAPREGLVGFIEPNAALATVRKISSEQLAQFPATAVHAFTPDATQLIVSDCRGVLRFWDVAAGRIVRTLRLDDSPPDTFLVAAIQAASEFGQPERNRKELGDLIGRAAYRGAQVVVLPETAVTGYMSDDLKQTWRVGDRPMTPGLTGIDPKDAAETVPGPSTRFFGNVARQWGAYLTVPLLEADRKTGRYYNTVVLIAPDGGILIHYRKLNPWPWAEQGWASEGNLGHPVVDTPFGRLGVLICFDIHKQAQELAKLKIDTLLYSIAWVDDKDSDWFPKRLPRIAATHGYNIVAANWTVPKARPEPAWHGYGQSTIVDASGRVLASAEHLLHQNIEHPHGQDIILAELPLPTTDGPANGR